MGIEIQSFNKEEIKRVFTDRNQSRKNFWDAYNQMQYNIENDICSKVKIINYYGIGGIGKSALIKQLQKEIDEKIGTSALYTSYDMQINPNKRGFLESIKTTLDRKYSFNFPIFELAMMIYKIKIGEIKEYNKIENFLETNNYLSTATEALNLIPVVGPIISSIVKTTDIIIGIAKTKYQNRKAELSNLQMFTPAEILDTLQMNLAQDMHSNMQSSAKPLVVFIDTYEELVNELISIGEPLMNDFWLHDLYTGLIPHIPRTIWIIGGREKLKWIDINPKWNGSLSQHLIGDLSELDTFDFLEHSNITDLETKTTIYNITNGTPLFLDLCVDNYYHLINSGLTPTIDNIGKSKNLLVKCYLKYSNDNIKEIVYLISCLNEWTFENLLDISSKILTGVVRLTLEKIKDLTFINSVNNETYTMHKTVKDIIYSVCPNWISNNVQKFQNDRFSDIQSKVNISDSSYIKNLKDYINYYLSTNPSDKALLEFYFDKATVYFNDLNNAYQYNEINEIIELFVRHIDTLDNSLTKSKIYIDYVSSLTDLGKYKRLVEYAEIAYSICIKNLKETDPRALESLESLLESHFLSGNYVKSLELNEKIVKLNKRVYGKKHPITLNVSMKLATNYKKVENMPKALKMSKRNFKTAKRTFGINNPELISYMSNLANTYDENGKSQMALKLGNEALELSIKAYGDKHPSTVNAMLNLGVSYHTSGQLEAALELKKKAYEFAIEIYGEKHPITIVYMKNLAGCYEDLGDIKHCTELTIKVLQYSSEVFDANHPDAQIDKITVYL